MVISIGKSERIRVSVRFLRNPTDRGQHSDDRGQSGEGLRSAPDRHPNQLIRTPQPRAGRIGCQGQKYRCGKFAKCFG
jgi:hypothetical protein